MSYREISEIRDGMRIDWDVPIEMDDGIVLRCRRVPAGQGGYAIRSSSAMVPTARVLLFEDGYKTAWDRMVKIAAGRDGRHDQQVPDWEVVDPEKWVPDGYVFVRVDSRGAGRSPGFLDSGQRARPRTLRLHRMGRRAAVVERQSRPERHLLLRHQPVAGGGVQPPHLAAMCVWEGFADYYREHTHHGGILSHLRAELVRLRVKPCSTASAARPAQPHQRRLGVGTGDAHREQMGDNRYDLGKTCFAHPFDDDYYQAMRRTGRR